MGNDKPNQLTDKQKRFCQEYLIDFNATQAAIRAGYSAKTARSAGHRMLTNVDIQAELGKLKKPIEEKLQLNAEWVLRRLKEVVERCMAPHPH